MRRKISRDSIKRGFKGKENIQGVTAVGKTNWKHFFLLWKRLALCWKKTQKWEQRTFCFQAVSKALSLVLTTFWGKGFDKSHAQPYEERGEGKGEQRCWGPAKPSLGGPQQRHTPGEARSMILVTHSLVFPKIFYLELILNPLFFAFS